MVVIETPFYLGKEMAHRPENEAAPTDEDFESVIGRLSVKKAFVFLGDGKPNRVEPMPEISDIDLVNMVFSETSKDDTPVYYTGGRRTEWPSRERQPMRGSLWGVDDPVKDKSSTLLVPEHGIRPSTSEEGRIPQGDLMGIIRIRFGMEDFPPHMDEETLETISAKALEKVDRPTYYHDPKGMRTPTNIALGGILKHKKNGVPSFGAVLSMETVHAARNAAIDVKFSRGVAVRQTIPNNIEMGYHDDFVYMIGLRVISKALATTQTTSVATTQEKPRA